MHTNFLLLVFLARNAGYSFAVLRVYQSLGICDPNGPANINDAWCAAVEMIIRDCSLFFVFFYFLFSISTRKSIS